jgi:hypothetical protein
VDFFNKRTGTP